MCELPDRGSRQPVVGIGNVDQVNHELGSVHLDVESPSATTAAGQTRCTGTVLFQREDIETLSGGTQAASAVESQRASRFTLGIQSAGE